MSYSQWGHKESSPNRHGRGEGKGVPAPGKNAHGKKAKYSKTGSSRARPLPKRAQDGMLNPKAKKTEIPEDADQKRQDQDKDLGKGKPAVRAAQVRSVRARLRGNPAHHAVGRR